MLPITLAISILPLETKNGVSISVNNYHQCCVNVELNVVILLTRCVKFPEFVTLLKDLVVEELSKIADLKKKVFLAKDKPQ